MKVALKFFSGNSNIWIISGLASIDYYFHLQVLCLSRNFILYSRHYEYFALETLNAAIFAKEYWCFCY